MHKASANALGTVVTECQRTRRQGENVAQRERVAAGIVDEGRSRALLRDDFPS